MSLSQREVLFPAQMNDRLHYLYYRGDLDPSPSEWWVIFYTPGDSNTQKRIVRRMTPNPFERFSRLWDWWRERHSYYVRKKRLVPLTIYKKLKGLLTPSDWTIECHTIFESRECQQLWVILDNKGCLFFSSGINDIIYLIQLSVLV